MPTRRVAAADCRLSYSLMCFNQSLTHCGVRVAFLRRSKIYRFRDANPTQSYPFQPTSVRGSARGEFVAESRLAKCNRSISDAQANTRHVPQSLRLDRDGVNIRTNRLCSNPTHVVPIVPTRLPTVQAAENGRPNWLWKCDLCLVRGRCQPERSGVSFATRLSTGDQFFPLTFH